MEEPSDSGEWKRIIMFDDLDGFDAMDWVFLQ